MAPMGPLLIVSMASSLIQPVASSLVNAITGKGVMRARKGQESGILPLLTLPLMMKVLEEGVTKDGKGYNNIDHMDENFYFYSIL